MEKNDKKITMKEEKDSSAHVSHQHTEHKHEENNHAHAHAEHKPDHKEIKSESKENKEPIKEKPKIKKDHAVVRAYGVHMSKRHGMYICSFIKGKKIDSAINELEEVIMLKRAVPFKGEIPHRKGKMMSGRYPVDAAKIFIPMLKNLKGGVLFNGMDITKTRISSAYSNFASRPQRRGGMKGKRAYITIEAKELKK